MDKDTEEAFHAAGFGYGVTKKQARLLSGEIFRLAMDRIALEGKLQLLQADLDGQRELVEKLTKEKP